ncbi:hypothetical protein SDC9_204986 [bioreactor metagenome]|uniref:Uncharacterized protein n=1 Tax=bioreactor metagenome TaxID=1076179 RepID=A0A645J2F0_9ZZZZ
MFVRAQRLAGQQDAFRLQRRGIIHHFFVKVAGFGFVPSGALATGLDDQKQKSHVSYLERIVIQ